MFNIDSIFTAKRIATAFQDLDPVEAPIFDKIFNSTPTLEYGFDYTFSNISRDIKTVAVVDSQNPSITVGELAVVDNTIRPLGINLKSNVTAKDLLQIKTYMEMGREGAIQNFVTRKIKEHRDIHTMSNAAMASLALSGTEDGPERTV